MRLLESHVITLAEAAAHATLIHASHLVAIKALAEGVWLESLLLLLLLLLLLHTSKRLVSLPKAAGTHLRLLLTHHTVVLHPVRIAAHLVVHLEVGHRADHWLEGLLLLLRLRLSKATHQATLILHIVISRSHHTIKRRVLVISRVCV